MSEEKTTTKTETTVEAEPLPDPREEHRMPVAGEKVVETTETTVEKSE